MSWWRGWRTLVWIGCLLTSVAGAADDRVWLVGFAQDTLQNDWRQAQAEALRAALADDPRIRLIVRDGGGSAAVQGRHILELARLPVDVLVTSPRDARLLTPVVAEVEAAGIPVVLLTRRLSAELQTSRIGPDDLEIGRQAAHFMAQALGGRGRILMLEGPPTATTAQDRSAGFLEALADYEGLLLVAREQGDYRRGAALQAVERVLAAGVRFDAIFAHSDSMAAGARLALREAGLAPEQLVIVGVDYIAEAREAIRRGEQTASFVYPLSAQEGAEVVRALLRGEPVQARVAVPSGLVTRDNVEQWEPIF